jgi:hypothetical protein
MEAGNPQSRRRLETRILHHERLAGDEGVGDQSWQGYTYLWNDEQTDAVLLEDSKGLDRTFTIRDSNAPGGRRQQTWHFPSRTECAVCHNMAAKYVLGAQTLQMNRHHDYAGVVANQLDTLDHLNIFTERLPEPGEMPAGRIIDPNARICPGRSYLHATVRTVIASGAATPVFNYCHARPVEIGTVGVRPPGNLRHSARGILAGRSLSVVLFYRMVPGRPGRMPRIGSNV